MIVTALPASRTEVADHYDDLDTFYREIWGEHVHHGLWKTGKETSDEAVIQLITHLAVKIGLSSGDELVDVGCGYGATSRYLTKHYGAHITALTVSPAQHAYASACNTGAGCPEYLVRDWLDNGLSAGRFDRAIAIESTEHMGDKQRVFTEMYRVLKPGGTVGIYAWIARDQAKSWEVRHLLEPICREGRLPGMGTETDYRELMQRAGFADIGVEDLSQSVRRTWRHCAMRVGKRLMWDGRYRKYLLDAHSHNRIFAASLLRIWLAYRVGAMRYLLFTAHKPISRGAL